MIRILKISLFFLFVAAVLILMGFIHRENGNRMLKGTIVRIDRETEKGFLNDSTLKTMVERMDSVSRKKIKDIPLKHIERIIGSNAYVEQADAFVNLDRNLIINVREKTPLFRVFPRNNSSYYVSASGYMFPVSEKYTARVPVVNGYLDMVYDNDHPYIFDTAYKTNTLREIYRLIGLIDESNFLRAQISQVYVNSKGEFDLIPQVGDHIIRMGTIDRAAEKLANLEIWYKKAMLMEDLNKYEIVNIKYKNQIVCTQK